MARMIKGRMGNMCKLNKERVETGLWEFRLFVEKELKEQDEWSNRANEAEEDHTREITSPKILQLSTTKQFYY